MVRRSTWNVATYTVILYDLDSPLRSDIFALGHERPDAVVDRMCPVIDSHLLSDLFGFEAGAQSHCGNNCECRQSNGRRHRSAAKMNSSPVNAFPIGGREQDRSPDHADKIEHGKDHREQRRSVLNTDRARSRSPEWRS